jgi:hypothetical protein
VYSAEDMRSSNMRGTMDITLRGGTRRIQQHSRTRFPRNTGNDAGVMSESFWVITGTTRNGELSDDLQLAAQSKATVSRFDGYEQTAKRFAHLYKTLWTRAHLPMAIIQNGTREDEKSVIGQVWEMPRLADARTGIGTPAIMVMGEVVSLSTHPMQWNICKICRWLINVLCFTPTLNILFQ